MTRVVTNITWFQCPACLWQSCLIQNSSPSKALIITSNFTRHYCISGTNARLGLHYLISGPAHKAGTVKSFRPVGNREITIIVIIISGWIRKPLVIPVCHSGAKALSGRIIPAAAPDIKSFSNWLQCTCKVILNGLASCISTWWWVILLLTQADTGAWELIFLTVNGLYPCIHCACWLVKVILGTLACIVYPACSHHSRAFIEIVCNVIDLLKACRHNSISLEISFRSGRTGKPSCSHDSCLSKITGISLAILYKPCSSNTWFRIQIICLVSKLQPFSFHISCGRIKITSLSFRIGKPPGYHRSRAAGKITLSALWRIHPSFYLNTSISIKIIFSSP